MNRRTRTFSDRPQPELIQGSSNDSTVPTAPANPATDKQQAFILTLLSERDLAAGGKLAGSPDEIAAAIERIKASVPTLEKKAASAWIEKLLSMPKLQTAAPERSGSSPKVPNGRYALDASTIGDGNDSGIRFYKVNTPTEGRWAGFTFVDAQASDDFHPIRNRAHKDQILAAIALDPKAALLRYGQELGSCGHCGRTLTDETSRELGIGPVCRDNLGW